MNKTWKTCWAIVFLCMAVALVNQLFGPDEQAVDPPLQENKEHLRPIGGIAGVNRLLIESTIKRERRSRSRINIEHILERSEQRSNSFMRASNGSAMEVYMNYPINNWCDPLGFPIPLSNNLDRSRIYPLCARNTNATFAPYREDAPSDLASLLTATNTYVRNGRPEQMWARGFGPAIRNTYGESHKVSKLGGKGNEPGLIRIPPPNPHPRPPGGVKGWLKKASKWIKALFVAIGAAIVGLFKSLVSDSSKPPHEKDK